MKRGFRGSARRLVLRFFAPAAGAGHQEGNRALPADDRRRQPGGAVRARGRGAVEEAAGPEARSRSRNATSASDRACSRAPMRALPRYFKDADRVMDLETRLLHCMTTLQGRSREEATAARVRQRRPALRDGVPFGLRRGAVARHENGRRARAIRRRRRPTSSVERSTSTVPAPGISPAPAATARKASASGMQELPVLLKPADARRPWSRAGRRTASRPASSSRMQWRMNDCYRRCACPSRPSAPRPPSR